MRVARELGLHSEYPIQTFSSYLSCVINGQFMRDTWSFMMACKDITVMSLGFFLLLLRIINAHA